MLRQIERLHRTFLWNIIRVPEDSDIPCQRHPGIPGGGLRGSHRQGGDVAFRLNDVLGVSGDRQDKKEEGPILVVSGVVLLESKRLA